MNCVIVKIWHPTLPGEKDNKHPYTPPTAYLELIMIYLWHFGILLVLDLYMWFPLKDNRYGRIVILLIQVIGDRALAWIWELDVQKIHILGELIRKFFDIILIAIIYCWIL